MCNLVKNFAVCEQKKTSEHCTKLTNNSDIIK